MADAEGGTPQTNEQPLGGEGLGTDELKYCHGDKQGGDTIEELGDDKPQEVLSTGSPNKL